MGAGSSPLTRGKPSFATAISALLGLIPAHAGKTAMLPLMVDAPGAHPRSRGENQDGPRQPQAVPGSSPLTRGKLLVAIVREALRGLIPAHAGKIAIRAWGYDHAQAHPRSRGENRASVPHDHPDEGSSPLTRGKWRSRSPRVGPGGLIPAHAGKIRPARGLRSGTAAHPRSRGENIAR